jgi:ribulose-phosphate 3-epimerase
MSVNPGWGGQAFIDASTDKVKRMRQLRADAHLEVDGGLDAKTAPLVAVQGANLFVAGSAIFGQDDPAAAYREIAASVNS